MTRALEFDFRTYAPEDALVAFLDYDVGRGAARRRENAAGARKDRKSRPPGAAAKPASRTTPRRRARPTTKSTEGDLHPGVAGLPGDCRSEYALMAAVMGQALLDLASFERRLGKSKARGGKHVGKLRREYTETRAWFQSEDADYLHAFESCCAVLDLSPEAVREAVLRRWPALDGPSARATPGRA